MSFPRYAAYKDSGIEWLGEVPDGWEVKPIKKLGSIVSGYAFPSSDFVKEGEIRVLKISNIQTGYLDWSDESYLPKSSYIDNFSVKNGDIIFALTRPIISTGIKAAVAVIGESEIVLLNQRNALFRPFSIAERKFLYYILFDYNFKASFENCIDSTGQQPNISPIDIGNIFVAVPPIKEQTTIAAFLDCETAKIDNLINEQKKLIELLKEKRQAVISTGVTKGLNPHAPMKDSGVEWLGEVPMGWEIVPLKYFTNFSGGGTPSRDNLDYWNGDIPWVSPKDMKVERINSTEEYITEQGLKNSSSSLITSGQILIVVRSGILKHTIPVAINDIPVTLNQDMKALCFNKSFCINSFFFRWVQGLNGVLLLAWAKQGATVESIEHNYLAETLIPLPPIEEQTTIVAFLDQETAKIDNLIQQAQKATTLLQERRTALISAAVTGKIDVRNKSLPASL